MTETTAAPEYPFPATRDNIRLGVQVRDDVTGFTGIAVNSLELLTGTKQYGIQPTIAEGAPNVMPEPESMDWQRLTVIGEGISARYEPIVEPEDLWKLGDDLKSVVNGFKGIAVGKSLSLNGCIRFTLESKTGNSSSEKEQSHHMSFDFKELVKNGESIAPQLKAEPNPSRPPGGPSLKGGLRPQMGIRR